MFSKEIYVIGFGMYMSTSFLCAMDLSTNYAIMESGPSHHVNVLLQFASNQNSFDMQMHMVHENEFTEFLFFIIKRLYFFHQVTLSNWNQ